MGVGPIETVQDLGEQAGRKEMMDTTAMHFDQGYALNGFGWVTAIWEVSIGHDKDLAWWLRAVTGEMAGHAGDDRGRLRHGVAEACAEQFELNYRFDAKGTGAPGSEKELEIFWFMNREFRLALLRNWMTNSPRMVIDFTRYDLRRASRRGCSASGV